MALRQQNINNNFSGAISINGGVAILGDSSGLNLNIQHAVFIVAGPDGTINAQQLLTNLQTHPTALIQGPPSRKLLPAPDKSRLGKVSSKRQRQQRCKCCNHVHTPDFIAHAARRWPTRIPEHASGSVVFVSRRCYRSSIPAQTKLPDFIHFAELGLKYLDACFEDLRLHDGYSSGATAETYIFDSILSAQFQEALQSEYEQRPPGSAWLAQSLSDSMFDRPSYSLLEFLLALITVYDLDGMNEDSRQSTLLELDTICYLCTQHLRYHPITALLRLLRSSFRAKSTSWVKVLYEMVSPLISDSVQRTTIPNEISQRCRQYFSTPSCHCCPQTSGDKASLMTRCLCQNDPLRTLQFVLSSVEYLLEEREYADALLMADRGLKIVEVHGLASYITGLLFSYLIAFVGECFEHGQISTAFAFMARFVSFVSMVQGWRDVARELWIWLYVHLGYEKQRSKQFIMWLYYETKLQNLLGPWASQLWSVEDYQCQPPYRDLLRRSSLLALDLAHPGISALLGEEDSVPEDDVDSEDEFGDEEDLDSEHELGGANRPYLAGEPWVLSQDLYPRYMSICV